MMNGIHPLARRDGEHGEHGERVMEEPQVEETYRHEDPITTAVRDSGIFSRPISALAMRLDALLQPFLKGLKTRSGGTVSAAKMLRLKQVAYARARSDGSF